MVETLIRRNAFTSVSVVFASVEFVGTLRCNRGGVPSASKIEVESAGEEAAR